METEGTNSLSDTFTDGFANFPMYHLRARKNLKNTLRAHGQLDVIQASQDSQVFLNDTIKVETSREEEDSLNNKV